MSRFSEKELKLLQTFFQRQEQAAEDGFKIKKTKLYREIFNNNTCSSQTANTAFNLILGRFEALDISEQNRCKKEWGVKAKQEEINKVARNIELHKAHIEGKEEAQEKFEMGYKHGKKLALKQIDDKITALDLKSADGRVRAREYLFSKLDILLDESISEFNPPQVKVSAMKCMVDLLKDPTKEDDEEFFKKVEEAIKMKNVS